MSDACNQKGTIWQLANWMASHTHIKQKTANRKRKPRRLHGKKKTECHEQLLLLEPAQNLWTAQPQSSGISPPQVWWRSLPPVARRWGPSLKVGAIDWLAIHGFWCLINVRSDFSGRSWPNPVALNKYYNAEIPGTLAHVLKPRCHAWCFHHGAMLTNYLSAENFFDPKNSQLTTWQQFVSTKWPIIQARIKCCSSSSWVASDNWEGCCRFHWTNQQRDLQRRVTNWEITKLAFWPCFYHQNICLSCFFIQNLGYAPMQLALSVVTCSVGLQSPATFFMTFQDRTHAISLVLHL